MTESRAYHVTSAAAANRSATVAALSVEIVSRPEALVSCQAKTVNEAPRREKCGHCALRLVSYPPHRRHLMLTGLASDIRATAHCARCDLGHD